MNYQNTNNSIVARVYPSTRIVCGCSRHEAGNPERQQNHEAPSGIDRNRVQSQGCTMDRERLGQGFLVSSRDAYWDVEYDHMTFFNRHRYRGHDSFKTVLSKARRKGVSP